jgi:hypothetical protein
MRTPVAIVLIAALLTGVAYQAVTPYFAFGAMLNAAVTDHDPALDRWVDYPALRSSVTRSLAATSTGGANAGTRTVADALSGIVLGALGGALGDAIATPAGVRELLGVGPLSSWTVADVRGMHDRAIRHYRAWDRYEVTIPEHHLTGDALTYVFERRGLGWRLTGVAL